MDHVVLGGRGRVVDQLVKRLVVEGQVQDEPGPAVATAGSVRITVAVDRRDRPVLPVERGEPPPEPSSQLSLIGT